MKIELRYFTGTGNSLKVLETCKNVFFENGHSVEITEITPHEINLPESDLVGFCFPVYAFGIPRICRKYLNALEKFDHKQKVFVLINAGDSDESGFSVKECERILRMKNCDVIYTRVIQMPINWITSPVPPFPPSKAEAIEIIKNGVELAAESACDILKGIRKYHTFNYPKRYSKLRFYKDYWLFKYMGLPNMWRMFNVYDSCNGCQTCAKICPTQSITMTNKKPVWSSTCEQCMRCVNFCPKEAIYQSMGGDTKGRNRYVEPSFVPTKK
jgi:ferredoxin